jgi:hypothetical protein
MAPLDVLGVHPEHPVDHAVGTVHLSQPKGDHV